MDPRYGLGWMLEGLGQFGRFRLPPRTMDSQGWAKIPSYYYDAKSAPGQQRFQSPNRAGPLPQFVTVEALLDGRRIAYGSVSGPNYSRALSYLNAEVQKQLLKDTVSHRFQVVDESTLSNMHVFTLKEEGVSIGGQRLHVDVINEALRLLGFAIRVGFEIYPKGLRGTDDLGRYPPSARILTRPPDRLRPTAVQAYRKVQARSSNTASWIQISDLNRNFAANEKTASDSYFSELCSRGGVFVKQFELAAGEWRVVRESQC